MSNPNRYIAGRIKQKVVELHDKLVGEGKPVPEKVQYVYDCVQNGDKTCDQETLSLTVKELREAGYFLLPGHDIVERLSNN